MIELRFEKTLGVAAIDRVTQPFKCVGSVVFPHNLGLFGFGFSLQQSNAVRGNLLFLSYLNVVN